MGKKGVSNLIVVVLIIFVLAFSLLSVYLLAQINPLQNQINGLLAERDDLSSRLSLLNSKNDELIKENEHLKSSVELGDKEVESLKKQVNELYSQIQILNQEKSDLQEKYSMLRYEMDKVNLSYSRFKAFLLSYSTWNLNYTFKRVFDDKEILSLKSLLLAKVLTTTNDPWRSFQDIYNWITKNIKYVYDEPFPVPPSFNELVNEIVQNETVLDSIMAPSESLKLMQGDCDDQSILSYAMIKSYEAYVLGKEYRKWLMVIYFNDDSGHMCLAIPVLGDGGKTELTILDPAGHYLTNKLGVITSKEPLSELNNYSSYWSSHRGIKTIELYRVEGNVAYLDISGSISDVADFIGSI
ncbi:MAG: transglutaminase-like domain-containing protein [Nitrososphaeria archaeon]